MTWRRDLWGWLPSTTQLQSLLAVTAAGLVVVWRIQRYVPTNGEVAVVLFMLGQRVVTKGDAIKRDHEQTKRARKGGHGGRETRLDVDGDTDRPAPHNRPHRFMYGRHHPRRRLELQ